MWVRSRLSQASFMCDIAVCTAGCSRKDSRPKAALDCCSCACAALKPACAASTAERAWAISSSEIASVPAKVMRRAKSAWAFFKLACCTAICAEAWRTPALNCWFCLAALANSLLARSYANWASSASNSTNTCPALTVSVSSTATVLTVPLICGVTCIKWPPT